MNEKDWDTISWCPRKLVTFPFIYSIYLEWKGLRQRVHMNMPKQRIIDTTNLFYIPWMKRIETTPSRKKETQEPSSVSINLFYIPWMKRIETSRVSPLPMVLLLYLFYIPWMKRIETCFYLLRKYSPSKFVYLFYIPWMKRIETVYIPSTSKICTLSILYTLNEKDWDSLQLFLCKEAHLQSILYTLNEKDWDPYFIS